MKRNHSSRRGFLTTSKPSHSTRRSFLKTSAAALGAAAVGRPSRLAGAAGSTAANSKLNLAVVGCGGQGRGDMRVFCRAG